MRGFEMGGSPQIALAEALCARLCHEIASPLGTLAGALDVVIEDPAMAGEALPLASEAAGQLALRLRLLRTAWGGECGTLSAGALADLADGLPPRVQVDLAELAGPFEAPLSRIIVNMLLLGAEAMPRGGVVRLSGTATDGLVMVLEGAKAAWPADLREILLDPSQAKLGNPRLVQAPFLAHLAQANGFRLSLLLPAGSAADIPAPLLLSAA